MSEDKKTYTMICNICKKDFKGAKKRYKKLWHDRIDEFATKANSNPRSTTLDLHPQILVMMSNPILKEKLKAKFDKGMEEHGMGFEKVDFDAEIENEILDICNYLIGKQYSEKE